MYVSFRVRRRACWAVGVALSVCVLLGVVYRAIAPVSGASESGVALPIVMYHSVLKSADNRYEITPDLLESDLQYLTAHGYTTVTVQDLLDYVHNGTSLPDRPVMLTFDDGHYNNYTYAYPLMKRYGCRMVLSPIGIQSEIYSQTGEANPNYGYVRWEDLREMAQSGVVEIQNHSYNLHTYNASVHGSRPMAGETDEAYRTRLRTDLATAQTNLETHVGVTPTAFVYPFGATSDRALPVLRELGFSATLICESKTNVITRDPACLYGLGRFIRTQDTASADFFARLE